MTRLNKNARECGVSGCLLAAVDHLLVMSEGKKPMPIADGWLCRRHYEEALAAATANVREQNEQRQRVTGLRTRRRRKDKFGHPMPSVGLVPLR